MATEATLATQLTQDSNTMMDMASNLSTNATPGETFTCMYKTANITMKDNAINSVEQKLQQIKQKPTQG
jgi:hypothetical protein